MAACGETRLAVNRALSVPRNRRADAHVLMASASDQQLSEPQGCGGLQIQ
jgi:hypothetical protein